MENNSFAQILKAEIEVVKLRAEIVIFKAVDWTGGARYAQRRRATHIGRATHITSPASVKYQGRYALVARYALGGRATHTVSELKILPLRPISCQSSSNRFAKKSL